MKKVKIALFFLFIFSLLSSLLLVGCKKNEQKKEKEEKVIKIGVILPLTGGAGKYGQYIKQSLELGMEEINEKGGINGKKLHIIYEDDQANPKLAVNAMKKLTEVNKVPLVYGSWASSCVLAEAPIAESSKVVILAEAQSPKIRDAGDFIFRIQPDSRYYLKFLVPFVFNNLHLRRLAIVFVNNDYGVDQSEVFKTAFEKLGGKIIWMEGFDQGQTDFRNILEKLKVLPIEGVFIPAYKEAGYFLKQAAEMKIKNLKIIGSSPMENPEIIKIAGKAADGVIYPYHFDPESNDPKIKSFIEKYKNKFGEEPEGYAALAYDAIYIISKALQRCERNSICIKDYLYTMKFDGVTGHTEFDDHGDVIKPIYIRTIKNGTFHTIWRPLR